jgi:hypothetical protein
VDKVASAINKVEVKVTKRVNKLHSLCNELLNEVIAKNILYAYSHNGKESQIHPLRCFEANQSISFYKQEIGKLYGGDDIEEAGEYIWNTIEDSGYTFSIRNIPIDSMCGYRFNNGDSNDIEFKCQGDKEREHIEQGLKDGTCEPVQLCDIFIQWGDHVMPDLSRGRVNFNCVD